MRAQHSRVFCISTQADGPWSRPDHKHRSKDRLTVPHGAATFSPYIPPSANSYLPMSRNFGDHVHRPRRAETTFGQRREERDREDHKLNPYRFAGGELGRSRALQAVRGSSALRERTLQNEYSSRALACTSPPPLPRSLSLSRTLSHALARSRTVPVRVTPRPFLLLPSSSYPPPASSCPAPPPALLLPTQGEPYTHPTFGFLSDWASEPYRHAYSGAHSNLPTSVLSTTRYSDTAAAALGKERPVTPATIARLATATRMAAVANLNRPSTAASSDRRRAPPGASAASAAPGVSGTSAAPAAGRSRRPQTAPSMRVRPSWSSWPEQAHKLRETSTLLRPPHTSRAAQIAQQQYPQVYGTRGKAATLQDKKEDAAAATLQAGFRGARDRKTSTELAMVW